jgi:hypothetical protein
VIVLHLNLRLLLATEGGRRSPISKGYRASWDNGDRLDDGAVHLHDALIQRLRDDPLEPGGETVAEITPLLEEFWTHVQPGDELKMFEGPHLVGQALVIEPN